MSWKNVSLADVSDVFNGKTPSKDDQRDVGHPVLKIKDVGENGYFKGPFESFVDLELAGKFSEKHLKLDDSLILNAAHNSDYVGSKQYRAEQAVVGALPTGEWLIARANTEKLHPRFLNYWLQSPQARFQIKQLVKGIHLYPKDVMRLEIPLPPLPEQKRIAAILDKADAIRRKRQQAIQLADDFLRAVFMDMFGDPVTNPKGWSRAALPDVAEKFTDGPFGSNLKSSHYVEDGVRVIRLQNIGVGSLLDYDLAFISEEHYQSLPRNHCQPGDVIVGTLGDPNLRACIIPEGLSSALNKADCLLFRPSEDKVLAEYICWLLNNPSLVESAAGLVRGQTRGRISLGRLKELEIPIPPLSEQERFRSVVRKLLDVQVKINSSCGGFIDAFSSLSQKAFSGQL